jgi:hypothetical protein
MPLSKYYGGRGAKVMAQMKKRYGAKKGKQVFYATANKMHQPGGAKAGKRKRTRRGKRKTKR